MTFAKMIQVASRKRLGRKPLPAEQRRVHRVEFMVTEAERQELKRVAEEERKPLAIVIREAVNEFVADYADRVVFLPSSDKSRRTDAT